PGRGFCIADQPIAPSQRRAVGGTGTGDAHRVEPGPTEVLDQQLQAGSADFDSMPRSAVAVPGAFSASPAAAGESGSAAADDPASTASDELAPTAADDAADADASSAPAPAPRSTDSRSASTNRTIVPGTNRAGGCRSRSHSLASVRPMSCQPPGEDRG